MSSLKDRTLNVLPTAVLKRLRRWKLMTTLQRDRFSPQQRRTNRMITVPGLERGARRVGSVWGVCLARNEEDVIAHTVLHMLDQGLDGVIVVDNLSTDATFEVLRGLAERDPRIHLGTDEQVGFHQGGKVSYLAHLAWRAGADWVVPFDADEFWYAEGRTVASFLTRQKASSVWCDFRNVFPTVDDNRIDLRHGGDVQVEVDASPWLRVCFRSRRWVWVGEGNHALRNATELPVRGLHMLHLSYRSLEQYSRKVDHGIAALNAAGKDESIATHWRLWASVPHEEREVLWSRYLIGDGVSADDPVVSTRRIRIADPVGWETWDPEGVLADAGAHPT